MAAGQLEVSVGFQVHSVTSMGLVEGEFSLATALLSKPETRVSSVYTWTDDTAEGV